MIDNEVVRLRNLRSVALRARAYAQALAGSTPESEAFSKSAVICWTLARITTGHLRAHPYVSYQKGPGLLHGLANRSIAALAAFNARRRGRCASLFAKELQGVARAVADARALTWSAELGDALGRTQNQLRRAAAALDARAQHETGNRSKPAAAAAALKRTVESNWPYLAI